MEKKIIDLVEIAHSKSFGNDVINEITGPGLYRINCMHADPNLEDDEDAIAVVEVIGILKFRHGNFQVIQVGEIFPEHGNPYTEENLFYFNGNEQRWKGCITMEELEDEDM